MLKRERLEGWIRKEEIYREVVQSMKSCFSFSQQLYAQACSITKQTGMIYRFRTLTASNTPLECTVVPASSPLISSAVEFLLW
jgi:hypothetical protein